MDDLRDVSIPELREDLVRFIRDFCYLRRDIPFTLKSGKLSHDYFDMRQLVYNAPACTALIYLVYHELGVTPGNLKSVFYAIGGGLGALPFACSFVELFPVAVRPAEKQHGLAGRTVFSTNAADPAGTKSSILLEDTITSAGSLIDTAKAALTDGFIIKQAFVIMDREEGGREAWEETFPDIRLTSIFRKSEFA